MPGKRKRGATKSKKTTTEDDEQEHHHQQQAATAKEPKKKLKKATTTTTTSANDNLEIITNTLHINTIINNNNSNNNNKSVVKQKFYGGINIHYNFQQKQSGGKGKKTRSSCSTTTNTTTAAAASATTTTTKYIKTIIIGDLVAYDPTFLQQQDDDDDDGGGDEDDDIIIIIQQQQQQHEQKFNRTKHQIGQILAVREDLYMDGRNKEYHVLIRPLLHWELFKRVAELTKDETKQIREQCRLNSALFETDTVTAVSAKAILSSDVRLVNERHGPAKDYKEQQVIGGDNDDVLFGYEYKFFVYGTYVSKQLKVSKDWDSRYHSVCPSFLYQYSDKIDLNIATFPKQLIRGWDCLSKVNSDLVQNMKHNLIRELKATKKNIAPPPQERHEEGEDEGEEESEDEEVEEENQSKENHHSSSKGRRGGKSATAQQRQRKQSSKAKPTATAAQKKKQKQPPPPPKTSTTRKSSVLKRTSTSSNNNKNTKKKRVEFAPETTPAAPANNNQKKAKKKKRTATYIEPRSDIVHRIRKKNIEFYTAFEVDDMAICVGDIIAVADDYEYDVADDVDDNVSSKIDKKKKQWAPFKEPWHAGQVVSIYRQQQQKSTSTQIFMEVRWFYWPSSLPEGCRLKVVDDIIDNDNDADTTKVVIEVDEQVSRVPITAALGRVAMNDPSCRFVRKDKNRDLLVATVANLTCNSLYCSQWDEDHARRLIQGDGWSEYGSRLAGPISRGLCCEKAWPGKESILQRKYKKFIMQQYSNISDHELDVGPTMKQEYVKLPGDTADGGSDGYGVNYTKKTNGWPDPHLFDSNGATRILVPPHYRPVWENKDNGVEFLSSVLVPVNHRLCDRRATANKSRIVHWTLKVGDIVCIADLSSSSSSDLSTQQQQQQQRSGFANGGNKRRQDNRRKKRKRQNTKKDNPWYPFAGTWNVCQILSIYRQPQQKQEDEDEDTAEGTGNNSQPQVELRRFLRKEDMPLHVQEWMPTPNTNAGGDDEKEHVYETDIVERDVPASHVLGPVRMFFAHSTKASSSTSCSDNDDNNSGSKAPTVSCRCRYFYSNSHQRFQPLYCYNSISKSQQQQAGICDSGSSSWHDYMLERGLKASNLIKQYSGLRTGLEFCLDVSLQGPENNNSAINGGTNNNNGTGFELDDIFSDLFAEEVKNPGGTSAISTTTLASPAKPLRVQPSSVLVESGGIENGGDPTNTRKRYYVSVPVQPLRGAYAHNSMADPKLLPFWTVRVGDLVAVRVGELDASREGRDDAWFPFTESWRPGQVLAIFQEEKDQEEEDKFFFEIRWFESQKQKRKNCLVSYDDNAKAMEVLHETDCIPEEPVDASRLLAPISLLLLASSRSGSSSRNSHSSSSTAAATRAAVWNALPPFLPAVPFLLRQEEEEEEGTIKTLTMPMIQRIIERGISLSSTYSEDDSVNPGGGVNGDDASPSSSTMVTKRQLLKQLREEADDLIQTESCYQLPLMKLLVADEGDYAAADASPNDKTNTKSASAGGSKNWTPNSPFFISPGLEFHDRLRVILGNHDDSMGKKDKNGDISDDSGWEIRLGDTVLIKEDNKAKVEIGEVVTIYRYKDTDDDDDDSGDESMLIEGNSNRSDDNDIHLEIRWLYAEDDVPLSKRRRLCKSCKGRGNSIEIYESDHYDRDLSPELIFGPATLVNGNHYVKNNNVFTCCTRTMWSFSKKNFIPISSNSSRVARGRMNSPFYKRYRGLVEAVEKLDKNHYIDHLIDGSPSSSTSSQRSSSPTTIQEAFQRVIEKLSLTDASKVEEEDSDEEEGSSTVLIGREKDLEKISNFLRSAIVGCGSNNNRKKKKNLNPAAVATNKSTLFIAGPPGVGKTACVRKAVSDLQREQQKLQEQVNKSRTMAKTKKNLSLFNKKSLLPPFDFVTLNGMELRNPYESYVKLWEEVSGDKGFSSCYGNSAPQVAATKLQSYFCSTGEDDDDDDDDMDNDIDRVVVVLLDEIDYLVTKAQDVIYNFFDWPIKSSSLINRPRLVVIGVSNTLNLPERMHPRVQSRIGTSISGRCYFKSYNEEEITNILVSKIGQATSSSGYKAFKKDAIIMAAKKTAALSGDIRKAFKICRDAAELVLNKIDKKATMNDPGDTVTAVGSINKDTIVTPPDIMEVVRQSVNSAQSRRITMCCSYEALMLVALASLSKSTGRERGGFDVEDVMIKMASMSDALGDSSYIPAPGLCETLDLLARLCEANFVALKTPRYASSSSSYGTGGGGGVWPLAFLNIDDPAIISSALRKTPHQKLSEKYLC